MNQPTLTLKTAPVEISSRYSDRGFIADKLATIPDHLHEAVKQGYNDRYVSNGSHIEANAYLGKAADKILSTQSPLGITADDDDDTLLLKAQKLAATFANMINGGGLPTALEHASVIGISPPQVPHKAIRLDDGAVVTDRDTIREIGQAKRLTSPRWLYRVMRCERERLAELQALRLRMIHKDASAYVTRRALAVQKAKSEMARDYMNSREAVSLTDGRVMNMGDVMNAGVSNPANLRNEMMMRISDGERYIQQYHPDYVCLFFTFTSPSAFHAMKMSGGYRTTDKHGVTRTIGAKAIPNPSYQQQIPTHKGRGKNVVTTLRENTPRLSHHWLTDKFADFRTWAKDNDIDLHYIRTTEPNHDATAHWHGLLWVAENVVSDVKRALNDTFLAEFGEEIGAWKHRVQIKQMDASKGSAAGYIAKYISKNIDGFSVGKDFESGLDAATGADAVNAWRKTWGIRAFQFSGNFAPVTHWRELRRITPQQVADRPLLAALRNAADLSDWYGFVVHSHRNPTVLHTGVIDLKDGSGITTPLDWCDFNPEDTDRQAAFEARATLAKPNAYGEVVPRAIGIKAYSETPLYTRDTVWEIQAKRGGESWLDKLREMGEHGTSWHVANVIDSVTDAASFSSISSSSPLGLVKNNCGTPLLPDEKEEIYQQMRRDYRQMRLNPNSKLHKTMNEKFPTWDSYENAAIDMMQHREMSAEAWAAHQERVAIMLEGMS
ncbi:replication endonuclease [Thiothrix fructosivorans]|uniref:Replication endonuclease n=1 Tax=Thiothrix fructosivorans TaxID=111770 RepID=A0A8B0SH19_9GAMM|nr:replication endonuclease [Thiothrix fructosivorans]MBO0615392.1 replication endonuclease [Thiothrix fructosivorans]QTX10165.1 replication endonuclease [Thiothrix fructosivorans]